MILKHGDFEISVSIDAEREAHIRALRAFEALAFPTLPVYVVRGLHVTKISAIKAWRNTFESTLKEALDAIELLQSGKEIRDVSEKNAKMLQSAGFVVEAQNAK